MKVFVIAGEPSGDRLGGALMAGLSQLSPDPVVYSGIGGEQMAAQGLQSLFPMQELSVMGLAEILPKYFHLKRRIRETADAVIAAAPDVLITIDSPDFCLRVAKLVREVSQVRTVHYVAPSVWAWRPKRAAKMAGVIDHVLALLPFEPPYMQAAGMTCDYVGHPVVANPQATPSEVAAFRADHGIGDAPLILALPGSRKGEVSRLAAPFGEALDLIAGQIPTARVVLPCAAPVADLVKDLTADWEVAPILIDPRDGEAAVAAKRAAFAAADVAVAASGTVSLELAMARTPMVIAYRMNWLTTQIMRHMMLVDTVTLVNLVSETRAVPEYLGDDCTAENMAGAVLRMLADPSSQDAAMALTVERLGAGGEDPGLRAAKSVLAHL